VEHASSLAARAARDQTPWGWLKRTLLGVLTDSTHRDQFLDRLTAELRDVTEYLAIRRRPAPPG
jgi:hypothetical protein